MFTEALYVYLSLSKYLSSTTGPWSTRLEQGLRAELGVVTEDDILMELTKWVEASDNDILSDIYQQTINYVVSGQHPTL